METSTPRPLLSTGSANADVDAGTQEEDPFLQIAGHFKDDPFWDEMQESIRRHRREMDAAWDVPE